MKQASKKKAKGSQQKKKKEQEPIKAQTRKLRFPTIGCLIFFVISFLSLILLSFLLPEPNEVQHPYLSSVSVTFHHIGETVFGPVLKYSLLALDWFRLPPDDAIIKFGVNQNVDIIYDNIGVPHIYAKSRNDMTMAIGFVHARDRLFQMEINRLLASGKLAEILGETVLPLDRLFRVYGFHRKAKEDLLHLSENIKEYLQSYTDGINEYLEKFESQLPIEFTLLGFKPKHWQVVDILAIARFISWQLGYGDQIEFSRLTISRILDKDLLVDLDLSSRTLIENSEVTLNLKVIRDLLDNYINPGGSNSFVISGKHTRSGKPILASDPHLQLTSPSIWYQMHMHSMSDDEPYHSVGVTMPGFPMTLYGHNGHVSWGCVLSLVDVKDHFLEKFDWEKELYEYKGEMIKPTVYKEEIFIKGNSTPHTEYVYETVHGPVISLLSEDKRFVKDGKHIETSLQSISNTRRSTIAEGFYKLGLSKNINEAKEALKLIDIVTLGFTIADNDNNIGYFTTGNIPIKKKGYGLIPSEGWSGKDEWQGIIPFDERPTIINPEKGFIVTSNNRMVDESYKYYLGESFFPNLRSTRLTERIEEVIASGKKFDVETVADIQNDVVDIIGLKFKNLFFEYFNEKSVNLTNDELLALEYFKQWDGKKDVNSVGGAISQAVLIESVKSLLRRRISEKDMNLFLGLSNNAIYNVEAFIRLIPNFVNLLANKDSKWWIGEGSSQSEILKEGFLNGFQWLKNEIGSNIHKWRWGEFHRVKWIHVLSRGKKFYLDQVFSVGTFECPGDLHTPNKAAYSLSKDNKRLDVNAAGVSYRQIIDHCNFDNSLWIHGPGQSGRISSKHHKDQVNPWLNGRYFNMQWSKDRVSEFEANKIILSEAL